MNPPSDPTAAAAAAPTDEQQQPPPTKRALKRIAKAESAREVRKQKKVDKKEAKKAAQGSGDQPQQQQQDEGEDYFPALPFEPLNPLRLARKQGLMQATALAAQRASPRIVIDIDGFEPLMTYQEKASMVNQVSYSYAANKAAAVPAQLHITGDSPFVLERLSRMGSSNWKDWSCQLDQRPLQQVFAGELDQVVYLSADSENEIEELDPGKIYVIGGIVDRNRHKGLCHTRALELGVQTGRFSLQKHHPNSGARVLTTNHCVDILLEYLASKQWPQAFQKCIPVRKDKSAQKPKHKKQKKTGEEGEEEDGEEEEDEEEEQEEEEQEEEAAKPPVDRRKRGAIVGADHGVGLRLARALYEQGWSLILFGKDADALERLVRHELTSNKGIAVHAVLQDDTFESMNGDAARLKDVVFTRFQDKKMDLLVLNNGSSSSSAQTNFNAKACVLRELKRFYTPKQGIFPRTVLINNSAAGEELGDEYAAWSAELKARLPASAVRELVSDKTDDAELLQWALQQQQQQQQDDQSSA